MYTILMEEKLYFGKQQHSYVCGDTEDLSTLIWMFENSKDVKEFKVFHNGIQCSWTNFGWGEFQKWVQKWSNQN
jgi:hypothetical protein